MSKWGMSIKMLLGSLSQVNKRNFSASENHSIFVVLNLSALAYNGNVAKIFFGVQGVSHVFLTNIELFIKTHGPRI